MQVFGVETRGMTYRSRATSMRSPRTTDGRDPHPRICLGYRETKFKLISSCRTQVRRLDLLVDGPSGNAEYHVPPHLDRVVGEAFVEPAQQGKVDRGGDVVFPITVHQDCEKMAV